MIISLNLALGVPTLVTFCEGRVPQTNNEGLPSMIRKHSFDIALT